MISDRINTKIVQIPEFVQFYIVKNLRVLQLITMSFKANISIIVHLHSFKNLALPHKARYALKIKIFQSKQQKNIAMPFNIIETDTKPKRNVSKDSQIEDTCFISKKFNIQYQEQEIELNDCCEFRLTLEGFPELKDSNLYIEFMLIENPSCYFRDDINTKVEFKQAESYKFKLQSLETGIFRYCEGQFSKGFISSFSFSLFLMVTDYRFHPYNSPITTESARQRARQKVQNLTELMEWSQKFLKNCEDGEAMFYKTYVKNLRYNSYCLQTQVNNYLKNSQGQLLPRAPIGQGGQLKIVNDKQFFDYVTNYSPPIINEQLIRKEIYSINQQNFYFVQMVSNQMVKRGINLKTMKEKYRTERKDLFGERVFRSLVFGKEPRNKSINTKIANKIRKKKKINQLKIVDQYLFMKKENQHFAFLEVNLPYSLKTKQFQEGSIDQVLRELSQLRSSQKKEEIPYDERNMLIVLVHGFQASTYDMELIKREIMKILPVAMFLNASSNQMNTDGDITIMGVRLADQIKNYIARFVDNDKEVIINFVGHSMGGIIARASLAHLQQYSKQFGFYLSLSSPHLGYLNGVDMMIKAGLWFMRKTNKALSLDQLTMEDKQHLKDTFLFKLSQSGHLRDFRKIILLSSSQDSYVPWHSARIQYYEGSGNRSKTQREMVDSIIGNQIVHRIDIHFDLETTKDIDSFIGRAAHINLLTQECILKLINEAIPNLFDFKQL